MVTETTPFSFRLALPNDHVDDLIEFAHAQGLVHSVALGPDGYNAYQLRASPRQITLWVRPDVRFSRAAVDGELLPLGQVMKSLVAAINGDDPRHREGTDASVGVDGRSTQQPRVSPALRR